MWRLLEIAEETLKKTFLRFAKLKVKGVANGFMHPLMEVPCEGTTTHVGIFVLGDYKYQSEVFNGGVAGLYRRSLGKEEDGDVELPQLRLVPHQMLALLGLVGESEKGVCLGME